MALRTGLQPTVAPPGRQPGWRHGVAQGQGRPGLGRAVGGQSDAPVECAPRERVELVAGCVDADRHQVVAGLRGGCAPAQPETDDGLLTAGVGGIDLHMTALGGGAEAAKQRERVPAQGLHERPEGGLGHQAEKVPPGLVVPLVADVGLDQGLFGDVVGRQPDAVDLDRPADAQHLGDDQGVDGDDAVDPIAHCLLVQSRDDPADGWKVWRDVHRRPGLVDGEPLIAPGDGVRQRHAFLGARVQPAVRGHGGEPWAAEARLQDPVLPDQAAGAT